MTIEEIKELLQIFNASGVGELELQRGENRLRIRRAATGPEYAVTAPDSSSPAGNAASSPASSSTGAHSSAASGSSASASTGTDEGTPNAGESLVKSPIVGTYYDAPAPDAPPFVKVGDSIEPGQVLCIIESMKLMNEIEAEIAGVVASKLVENGKPVEYGEALFAIRPK
jgi:acetyl-CoA carboxylase biotin carboxyl carrier protein